MRYADTPTIESAVQVDAPAARLWPLISDIHLLAELSSELQEVEWLDGADGPAVGHTFRGRNVHPQAGEWETVSTVVECEPETVFAWAVQDTANPTATWRFTLTPNGSGTELRQWARMGPGPSGLTPMIAKMPEKEERIVAARLKEWQAGIDANLAGIKARAETG